MIKKYQDYIFNNVNSILKKRLLITDKKKYLNKFFIKLGYTRAQADKIIQKFLWINRYKSKC